MKRILLLLLCTIGLTTQAQEYFVDGYTFTYGVAKQDSLYSIVATVKSNCMVFLKDPIMKIRTFSDELIELKGTVISNASENGGTIVNNVILADTDISSIAQFWITPDQLELLQHGIAKIRLTMTQSNHEKQFKKDKIGKALYHCYQLAIQDDETF
jgi:Ni,Fe-hydrogenase I large subunit